MSSTRKISLKSCDGEAFEVDEAVALMSQTIKHMMEEDCADSVIPLPNVASNILAKVIEYCQKHVEYYLNASDAHFAKVDQADQTTLSDVGVEYVEAANLDEKPFEDELKAWDADFVKVDQAMLFDIILAANYLNIRSLLDLTCQTVADMIKGRTPEEIRRTFNFTDDTTPEEEEEIRRENQWAFE